MLSGLAVLDIVNVEPYDCSSSTKEIEHSTFIEAEDCTTVFLHDVYSTNFFFTPGKCIYVMKNRHCEMKSSAATNRYQLRQGKFPRAKSY